MEDFDMFCLPATTPLPESRLLEFYTDDTLEGFLDEVTNELAFRDLADAENDDAPVFAAGDYIHVEDDLTTQFIVVELSDDFISDLDFDDPHVFYRRIGSENIIFGVPVASVTHAV